MKIICVGRNYADHARELNNDLPTEPVLFLKPETALLPKNHPFFYPDHTQNLHYELELVIRIERLGKHIENQFAHKYYSQVGLGIDFTARDTQDKCKQAGLPWEIAKAWDHSAPLGETFVDLSSLPDRDAIKFELHKNGETVQKGISSDMIFHFDELVSYISQYFTLKIGDLIYTGTPSGVGPVQKGDTLTGLLEGKKLIELSVK